MTNISLDKCPWCDGSGLDREFFSIGGIRECWDCEGTGFEYGMKAKAEYLRLEREEMERMEKDLNL